MNFRIKGMLTTSFLAVAMLLNNLSAQEVLTLEQCRQMALSQNKRISIAQKNIDAAKAARDAVYVSGKPTVDASVTGLYIGQPLNQLLPEYGLSASGGVTQPIYTGGRIKLGKQASDKGVEIQEEQKALTEAEVLLNVERAYWQVVNVSDKVSLGIKYKSALDSLYNDLQNSFAAGLIYKNDVLRVEVQRNEAELNISRARDGVVLSKLNLAQLIGTPGNTAFAIRDTVTGTFLEFADTALLSAINRPEIRLLQKAIEAQSLQRDILKANSRPTVGASANVLSGVGKNFNFTNGGSFLASYYGLVSVSVPIFDWGARKNRVKEQDFRISAQQTQLQETNELISLEVQQGYLQLNQSARRIQTAKTSLQQAEENLRLTQDRFDVGTVVGKDVLEAQVLWQQAYSNIIDAQVEYKINEAVFRKATGQR